jgi:hypothetical protein
MLVLPLGLRIDGYYIMTEDCYIYIELDAEGRQDPEMIMKMFSLIPRSQPITE